MGRIQIDGEQIQDDTLTGDHVADGSILHEDLESYSFATLNDVELTTLNEDDAIVFSGGKFKNKQITGSKLYDRFFTNVYVPASKVLQMHSPIIDGELKIDGEVYIL